MRIWHAIRQVFCLHRRLEFVRNIYGDEINYSGGNRSLWTCLNCHALIGKKNLYFGDSDSDDYPSPSV